MTKTKRKRTPPLHKRLNAIVEEMVQKGIQLPEAHEQLEKLFLEHVMQASDGNQSRAASRLDLHRNTLRRKLRAHGLI
jgi:DNA-binding NtrC family response regulator